MFSLTGLSFLKKLLSSPYFYILIGFLFLSYQIYNLGWNNCKADWDESVAVIKKANDELIDKKNKEIKSLNDNLHILSEKAVDINKKTETKAETITKKVYIYAKDNPDTTKSIDVEWLRTYADSLPK
ncbi:hypothetical protein KLEP7_gp177 [Pseudaeromonas phage vB_PpeM_ KLEP7]|nr:hypothetical protein KLEP7_gp177 [Pseudaeromonas phage vB_PpeM_ KLEP7]